MELSCYVCAVAGRLSGGYSGSGGVCSIERRQPYPGDFVLLLITSQFPGYSMFLLFDLKFQVEIVAAFALNR